MLPVVSNLLREPPHKPSKQAAVCATGFRLDITHFSCYGQRYKFGINFWKNNFILLGTYGFCRDNRHDLAAGDIPRKAITCDFSPALNINSCVAQA